MRAILSKNKIAIVGAGGLGREVRNLLTRDFEFAGFIDDNKQQDNYLGDLNIVSKLSEVNFLVAIGDPVIKRKVVKKTGLAQVRFANLVSTFSISKPEFLKGRGIIICDGVVLTVDCQLGSHVLLNLNVTIGHDVKIGDYCSIMPGANISGNVSIGEATLIGSGAVILQGISIGSNVKVGAGAVVTKNVPDNCTVVGVPAKNVGI